jgi:hypothetical protein
LTIDTRLWQKNEIIEYFVWWRGRFFLAVKTMIGYKQDEFYFVRINGTGFDIFLKKDIKT